MSPSAALQLPTTSGTRFDGKLADARKVAASVPEMVERRLVACGPERQCGPKQIVIICQSGSLKVSCGNDLA